MKYLKCRFSLDSGDSCLVVYDLIMAVETQTSAVPIDGLKTLGLVDLKSNALLVGQCTATNR